MFPESLSRYFILIPRLVIGNFHSSHHVNDAIFNLLQKISLTLAINLNLLPYKVAMGSSMKNETTITVLF
jgi:hypothetical protein